MQTVYGTFSNNPSCHDPSICGLVRLHVRQEMCREPPMHTEGPTTWSRLITLLPESTCAHGFQLPFVHTLGGGSKLRSFGGLLRVQQSCHETKNNTPTALVASRVPQLCALLCEFT